MGTDIISSTLSRVYFHPQKAKQYAGAYAEKMRARGYRVEVVPCEYIKSPIYRVDVFRKK